MEHRMRHVFVTLAFLFLLTVAGVGIAWYVDPVAFAAVFRGPKPPQRLRVLFDTPSTTTHDSGMGYDKRKKERGGN